VSPSEHLLSGGPGCPCPGAEPCLPTGGGKPWPPRSALGFRFKVFADYEAYIKCQGQVDQLFMVRAARCRVGRDGVLRRGGAAGRRGELG